MSEEMSIEMLACDDKPALQVMTDALLDDDLAARCGGNLDRYRFHMLTLSLKLHLQGD